MLVTVLTTLTATLLVAPESATPDAVILSDDASWTLMPDGAVVEEHQRRIRVLSERAHRRHADPRIRFWDDAETVEILAARVTQADGTIVETPAYGRNLVTPGGYSRWPAFAAARERVITMSGLEPQAVVELHWKKTTRSGTQPWLWGDIRLAGSDPVESRTVTVTIPEAQGLSHQLSGLSGGGFEPKISREGGKATFRWEFKDLPTDPDEPQAPSWRERSPRLLFTTCPQTDAFVAGLLKPVEEAASPAECMKKPIEAAVQAALDDPARVRAVQKLLRDSMNFVEQSDSWERMNCRPAENVFTSNYANTLESGAVLVAMLRAAGFSASPALLVQPPDWDARVPVPEGVAAVIARVDLAGQRLWIHPAKGMVSARTCPGHAVLGSDPSVALPSLSRESIPAEVAIQGRLEIEADGG